MDREYLLIILVALLVAIVFALIVSGRRRALPPGEAAPPLSQEETELQIAAQGLVDPVASIPPEALGVPIAMPADSYAERAEAAAEGPADQLTLLKGLGPKAAAKLNELGVRRYDQLAALAGPELARVDGQMGPLQGRIARDRWVEQAGYLAAGDTAGFEAKFGKLGG